MAIKHLIQRAGLSWRLLTQGTGYCLLVALAVLACSSAADASIIVPSARPFELRDLSSSASASSCGSSFAPHAQHPGRQDSDEVEQSRWLGIFSPHSGEAPSGSSSTSTLGNGSSGTNVTTLGSAPTIERCDADVIRWVSGARHLALPMPPGNDLLRPPQAV